MLIRRRNTTLFQRLIATSRQRCINVRTTTNDVDKRLFKRRNATLERRCILTLYQHFHCDVRSTSVFDVIYGCLSVLILRCLDVIYGWLDLCSIFLNQTRYICFALENVWNYLWISKIFSEDASHWPTSLLEISLYHKYFQIN